MNIIEPGFVRVTAASHPTVIANPAANALSAIEALGKHQASDVILFGELSLCGYSCGDLFAQDSLLNSCLDALQQVVQHVGNQVVAVGLPLRINGRLYNCGALLFQGRVVGLVPKQFLPSYQEFYEARWFAAADGSEPPEIDLGPLGVVPFGIDLLLEWDHLIVGIELCEDLWTPTPPSSSQAIAGANLLLNLSASNELIGKARWRETLVRSQSGRCLAAYAYASAGPSESSTDVVYGAHCMIAENGSLLAESERVGKDGLAWVEHTHATADIDLQKLMHDRQVNNAWQASAARHASQFRRIGLAAPRRNEGSLRSISATPFVPASDMELHHRCQEIFGIQCAALAQRVRQLPKDMPLNIGVSGGLDSTLALLVAAKTCASQGWPSSRIRALTMPGFGTTDQTLSTARELMRLLKVQTEEIDIRQLCLDTFRGLKHQPFGIDVNAVTLEEFVAQLQSIASGDLHDLVFENVQARTRTLLLMSRGFVLGTGDLSEQALGWSTYNGDHMSMYNVNTSIPKTLVRFLVKYLADHEFETEASLCLHRIVKTPITPELLPPSQSGQIQQHTEDTLGPYELHDFFLYHMIRFGTRPKRLLQLAQLAAFSQPYSASKIRKTLRTFLARFFANQFKRSCVPDGPKVGSVSLSPRGDWRMPSDADAQCWLAELEDSNES